VRDERRTWSGYERLVRELPHAEVAGETLVAVGEDGGHIYFTVPAPAIACSADALARLLHEVDAVLNADSGGLRIWFVETVLGGHVAGGTGGAWMTGALWIHHRIRGSAFAERIGDVLAGLRACMWPGGSDEDGKPERATDLLDLLETETGDAPAVDLIRRAMNAMPEAEDPSYEPRLRTALHRLLRASHADNRLEAARELVFSAPPDAIVEAVRAAAAGGPQSRFFGATMRSRCSAGSHGAARHRRGAHSPTALAATPGSRTTARMRAGSTGTVATKTRSSFEPRSRKWTRRSPAKLVRPCRSSRASTPERATTAPRGSWAGSAFARTRSASRRTVRSTSCRR